MASVSPFLTRASNRICSWPPALAECIQEGLCVLAESRKEEVCQARCICDSQFSFNSRGIAYMLTWSHYEFRHMQASNLQAHVSNSFSSVWQWPELKGGGEERFDSPILGLPCLMTHFEHWFHDWNYKTATIFDMNITTYPNYCHISVSADSFVYSSTKQICFTIVFRL